MIKRNETNKLTILYKFLIIEFDMYDIHMMGKNSYTG